MSDITSTPSSTSTPGSSTASSTSGGGSLQPSQSRVSRTGQSGPSALQTEYGTTTIADGVVAKIAALATREVTGVAELGGSVGGAISGALGRITGGSGNEPRTGGVNVEVGETQAAVDLTLKALYPASIHEVADAVRQNVRDRIESMTGLQVVEVNIAVVDLVFPGQEEEDQGQDSASPARSSRVE